MKKLLLVGAFTTGFGAAAAAHDFETTYETRADCVQAWVEMNDVDRDWLPATFPDVFQTKGDVMHFLTQYVRCDYDPDEDVWYMRDDRP
jgi:hypothetical protein